MGQFLVFSAKILTSFSSDAPEPRPLSLLRTRKATLKMEEASGLFWGIVLKPEKRYETVVEEDFRVTKACVDHTTLESGKVASVVLEKGSDEFILCNLVNPTQLDNSLDLNFAAGEKICFRTEGGATVHLTGHLAPDDGPDEMDGMMDGS